MSDIMVRATAASGALRAFCTSTRDIVNRAFEIHKTYPVATAALGRLITAAAMMGASLKSEKDSITLQLVGDGPLGKTLAIADSTGNVKGYVGNPMVDIPKNSAGKLDVGSAVGKNGFLVVVRDFGLKEPYVGRVPLVSGEIGDDVASYYAVSEQIPSIVGVGVLIDVDFSVKAAGGFIIQVMPGTDDEIITKLEENAAKIKSVTEMLSAEMTPEDILNEVLDGFDVHITDISSVSYHCDCARERVEGALISLGADDISDMAQKDKKAEITCNFCDKVYNFTENELFELVKMAKTTNR